MVEHLENEIRKREIEIESHNSDIERLKLEIEKLKDEIWQHIGDWLDVLMEVEI